MTVKHKWGRTLIRDRSRGRAAKEHTSLKSVLESSNIEALIETADVLGFDFSQKRGTDAAPLPEDGAENPEDGVEEAEQEVIPRRPAPQGLHREEYKELEKREFGRWKHRMNGLLSGGRHMTPYERNINVWRQLWTTGEISSVIIQVVDARNPMLFYTKDIRRHYPAKKHLLLLNKADLLSSQQILSWRDHLNRQQIDHAFYSALDPGAGGLVSTWMDVVGRVEAMRGACAPDVDFVVGMVGYPNVGKSSTINTLFGRKVVTTSAMPGKTKSIQTLELFREGMQRPLCICDCPGLVFPNFVAEKQDLILNGVLSLDQSRDTRGCLELLVKRAGVQALCAIYGVTRFVNDSRRSLCENFLHFLMRHKGHPEEGKTIKMLIRDYLEGKILFAHPPEDYAVGEGDRESAFNAGNKHLAQLASPVPLGANYDWYLGGDFSAGYTVKDAPQMSRYFKKCVDPSKKHYLRKGKARSFCNF